MQTRDQTQLIELTLLINPWTFFHSKGHLLEIKNLKQSC